MQEFKILRRKQSQEGDTGSKQEPVPVRAFNLMKMEATNVLFPQVNSPDWMDFPALVDTTSDSNYSVRRHNAVLKDLNRLRNYVVHQYRRLKPLAVPTDEVVEQITAIRNEFLSPPSLFSLAAKPVEQCGPSEPLGVSVKKMHDGVFSQLPIHDGQKCYGLLTADRQQSRFHATFLKLSIFCTTLCPN